MARAKHRAGPIFMAMRLNEDNRSQAEQFYKVTDAMLEEAWYIVLSKESGGKWEMNATFFETLFHHFFEFTQPEDPRGFVEVLERKHG